MTPIGHAAVGFVTGHGHRRLAPWVVALGGVLPDVDFLLLWAPQFNAWHRVITHNLSFVGVTAVLVGIALARWRSLGVAATILGLALGGLTHLLTDAVMDGNASNGLGVAILWPFSDAMWSPFNLLEPRDGGVGWNDPLRAAGGALRGMVWEVPWIAVAAVLVWARRRR